MGHTCNLYIHIKSLFSNDLKWRPPWEWRHRKMRLHRFFLILSKFFTWTLTKQNLSISGICILLEVQIYSGEMINLKLPVKDMWRSHHIFIWPWPFIMTFNLLDYVHIPNIKQVNVIHDIDAYVTRFSCMIHNKVYLHEYNMTFNDLYCLMTSTVKDMDHHVVSRHVQQKVLRNLSGQSLS